MKVAVVGSRTFNDYSKMETVLDKMKITLIVSGGANGADTLAEKYAKAKSIPIKVFPAEWNKYGKSAGFRRNQTIVENVDAVVAFWDGESVGTMNTLQLAWKYNKQVHIENFKPFTGPFTRRYGIIMRSYEN